MSLLRREVEKDFFWAGFGANGDFVWVNGPLRLINRARPEATMKRTTTEGVSVQVHTRAGVGFRGLHARDYSFALRLLIC